jgi:Peptidase A4 family
MLRRWSIPITTAVFAVGSLLGLAAGNASAAVAHPSAVHHSATTTMERPGGAAAHGFKPGGVMLRPGGSAGAVRADGHSGRRFQAESTNWSGYAVTGSNGTFKSVSANWTQPTATCSGNRRSDQYAAFWVGLDGYSSDSVEQTGSDSDCDGRTPDYYGWYEMYPADPVYYTNTVEPGDSMSASVTFSGTDTYTLVLKDSTRGWTETKSINESGFDRSSAEVITEAPCCTNSGGILPLADFGTVNYTAASANGSSMGTQSPTSIVMVDNSGLEKDSTSSISSSGAFSNTWIRSS